MAIKHKIKKNPKKSKMSKEIRYLEKLWLLSVKNIAGYSDSLDSLFRDQAKKIRAEIKKLQGKQ